MIRHLFSIVALTLITTIPVWAQDDDIDAAIKKAMENPNKPAASKADMKKLEQQAKAQMDEMEAENKAEEAKQKAEEVKKKAAAQAVVDAKGPTSFPDWTPTVPQFTPAGPPARKLADGQAKIIQTGTSTLSPETLCDEWDKFKREKFSHERGGSEINHNADLYVSYRNGEDNTEVKMEAERKAGGKVTHVTISSPLPVPSAAAAQE